MQSTWAYESSTIKAPTGSNKGGTALVYRLENTALSLLDPLTNEKKTATPPVHPTIASEWNFDVSAISFNKTHAIAHGDGEAIACL